MKDFRWRSRGALLGLLAAGWGDLYTNVTDLPFGSMAGPNGSRQVVVGTENRQNMLGHLALLGARRSRKRDPPGSFDPRGSVRP